MVRQVLLYELTGNQKTEVEKRLRHQKGSFRI